MLTDYGNSNIILAGSAPAPVAVAELLLGGMTTSQNTDGAVSAFCAALFVLVGLLALSLKTGKMLKSRVRFGESPFYDRKLDPGSFWIGFTVLSLVCGLLLGCVIWILIYGA